MPHSWPFMVLVEINYKFYVKLGNKSLIDSISYLCGGTLIDRKTVLTAGHCILESIDYSGQTIYLKPNRFYPTVGSMYTVYLGIHNTSEAKSNLKLTTGIAINGSRVIRVKLSKNFYLIKNIF